MITDLSTINTGNNIKTIERSRVLRSCKVDYKNIYFFDAKTSYNEVLSLQKTFVNKIKADPLSSKVYKLVGEHPPTYTSGLSVSEDHVKKLRKKFSVKVVQTDRGGQIMYHGPGQLTLYFIFNLKKHFSGPKDYVDSLFETVRQYFYSYHNLELEYKNQGLWLKDKKVGFMGIRIKKGVVYHGLSLNYYTDLKPFLDQSPCNINGSDVGNLFTSPLATLFIKDEAQGLVLSAPFR